MRRFSLLASLIYLLLLVGLATLSGRLLLLAIPLTIYLGAALLSGPRELRLSASRNVSADRVSAGAPVVIKLSVRNEGSLLEEVLVEDLLPPRLRPMEGESRMLATLPAGETLELEYTVPGRRGCFDFGDVRVSAADQHGLFEREVLLSAPARLVVLPETLRLRRVSIRPLRTRGYAGPVPARQGGSGIDFFGVREYRLGDPRRWINWRLSARHPRSLFTNEFEQERIADVGLILDARQRSEVRLAGESLFEYSVQATASLAETFLGDGNRVGLLVYGRFLDWTFPGYGKVQRERILQALARAETGDSLVFDKLDYLPTGFFPAQSQLVLISPLWRADLPMLVSLRARGYQVLVIRPDPVAFESNRLPPDQAVALAARVLRVERRLVRYKLQQAGIRVVDWQVHEPLDQAVHASLGRVPTWFRAVGVEW
jgi:uncharacterized protein (DUF58 family)